MTEFVIPLLIMIGFICLWIFFSWLLTPSWLETPSAKRVQKHLCEQSRTCFNCGNCLQTPNSPATAACSAMLIRDSAENGSTSGYAEIEMCNWGLFDHCEDWAPRSGQPPATQVADPVEPADTLEDIARDMYALIGPNLDIPHDVMCKLRRRFDERARAIGVDLSTEPYVKRTAEGVSDEN